MVEPKLFSPEHVQLIGLILLPIGSGIVYLIWQTSQISLKVETMWAWWNNHTDKGKKLVMKKDDE